MNVIKMKCDENGMCPFLECAFLECDQIEYYMNKMCSFWNVLNKKEMGVLTLYSLCRAIEHRIQ